MWMVSPFSTTTRPTGHSMNAWSIIQHSSHAIVGPWDLILILQVELNITALSMFWALGARLAQPVGPWSTVRIVRKPFNTAQMPWWGRGI